MAGKCCRESTTYHFGPRKSRLEEYQPKRNDSPPYCRRRYPTGCSKRVSHWRTEIRRERPYRANITLRSKMASFPIESNEVTAEQRRQAFHDRILQQLGAFVCSFAIAGTVVVCLTCIPPPIMDTFRPSNVVMSVLLLICTIMITCSPMMVAEVISIRDPRLYCPYCGKDLTRLKIAKILNKEQRCGHCNSRLEIAPFCQRQLWLAVSAFFVGLILVLVYMVMLGEVLRYATTVASNFSLLR